MIRLIFLLFLIQALYNHLTAQINNRLEKIPKGISTEVPKTDNSDWNMNQKEDSTGVIQFLNSLGIKDFEKIPSQDSFIFSPSIVLPSDLKQVSFFKLSNDTVYLSIPFSKRKILKAYSYLSESFTWSSSNPGLVSVTNSEKDTASIFCHSPFGEALIKVTGKQSGLSDSCYVKIIKSNQVGNTSANISKGGRLAYQDGWVVYADPKLAGKPVLLNLTTGVKKILTNEQGVRFINLMGDFVYYVNSSGNVVFKNFIHDIAPSALRLPSHIKVSKFLHVLYGGVVMADTFFSPYYASIQYLPFSLHIDANESVVRSLQFENTSLLKHKYIFSWKPKVSANRGGNGLMRMDQKSLEEYNKFVPWFFEHGHYVYYGVHGDIGGNGPTGVYRTNAFSTQEEIKKETLFSGLDPTSFKDFDMNILHDWIYFVNYPAKTGIWRKPVSGGPEELVTNAIDQSVGQIYVGGEWIFFFSKSGHVWQISPQGHVVKELK